MNNETFVAVYLVCHVTKHAGRLRAPSDPDDALQTLLARLCDSSVNSSPTKPVGKSFSSPVTLLNERDSSAITAFRRFHNGAEDLH
jgi:hypothetical protein